MDIFYLDCKNFEGNTIHEKQHNAGRYIVEYVAKNIYKIENPEIIVEKKKPKFKFSDIKFSISHSDCFAVVGFCKNDIGIDIEKMTKRNYKAIAKRMNFLLKEDSLEEFYRCWTTYEAKYKLQKESKSIFSQKIENEYIISVASGETTDIKNVLKIQKITF